MKKGLLFGGLALLVVAGLGIRFLMNHQGEPTKPENAEWRRSSVQSNSQTYSAPDYQSKKWQDRAKLFDKNKASAVAIFAAATKVESFRLFAIGQGQPVGKMQNFTYYAQGSIQDKTFAARLGQVVLDANTYSWPGESTKQCYFEPGVAFRIWSGTKFADAIICLHCNQLAVLENNPRIPERSIGGSLRGKFYVEGDFDFARSKIVALIQEAFPTEQEIQKLQ